MQVVVGIMCPAATQGLVSREEGEDTGNGVDKSVDLLKIYQLLLEIIWGPKLQTNVQSSRRS